MTCEPRSASRWTLLHQAARLLGGRQRYVRREGETREVPFRVASCHKLAKPWPIGAKPVHVHRTENRAFFSGLRVCGSPWHCPVCAARIARQRRRYLKELERAAAVKGYGVALVSQTTPHGIADRCDELLERLAEARRKMRAGRRWQRFRARWGYLGEARTLEVTHGANGWHPHYHGLFFAEHPPRTAEERAEFRRNLYELWADACVRAGLGRPSEAHGVDVQWGDPRQAGPDSCIADYIAKWGFAGEVAAPAAKRSRKGGRTPWELLAASRDDRRAAALWIEYAEAFEGRRQLTITPKLKQRLEPEQPDLDDFDAAQPDQEPEPGAEVVHVGGIDLETWGAVCKARAHEWILEAALEGPEAFAGALDYLRRLYPKPHGYYVDSS